ncbi:hypothetical protein CAOG_007949 [Capsaspora owczarzaki ATCC 30864]|uniref:C3HC-type domain-containing protein n=1 Tax=Capsaspora owczarzaki (strain ATCC 30864) TaxID=595528 RepID=A0A0D2WXF8_CAPO3|nr:hypothetical protein CAOG_007949 [Capsaspora owczarzaki ATCC 30864]
MAEQPTTSVETTTPMAARRTPSAASSPLDLKVQIKHLLDSLGTRAQDTAGPGVGRAAAAAGGRTGRGQFPALAALAAVPAAPVRTLPAGTVVIPSALCRPWERADYVQRLATFCSIPRWCAKPALLAPLECARYGWFNCDVDMLECVSCHSRLSAQLSDSPSETAIRKVHTQLSLNHKDLCPWLNSSCPDSFKQVVLSPPATAFAAFLERCTSLIGLGENLPAVSPEDRAEVSGRVETFNQLVQRVQDALAQPSIARSTIEKAALWALCNWSASRLEHAPTQQVLSCNICLRQFGLWNVPPKDVHHASDASAMSSESAAPAPAGQAANKRTSEVDTSRPAKLPRMAEQSSVHELQRQLFAEHRWYCSCSSTAAPTVASRLLDVLCPSTTSPVFHRNMPSADAVHSVKQALRQSTASNFL